MGIIRDTKGNMGYNALDWAKHAIEKRSKAKYGAYYKKLWKIVDHR